MLRIRSEHAIGFLKGRFQCLKSLRVSINGKTSHKIATFWIIAGIAVHAFAIRCEEAEKAAAGDDSDEDDDERWLFIRAGLSSAEEDADEREPRPPYQPRGDESLAAGKKWREDLKRAMQQARRERAERRRRGRPYLSSEDDDEDDISE